MKRLFFSAALLSALLAGNPAAADESENEQNSSSTDDTQKIVRAVENIVITYCSGLKMNASETLSCIADGIDKVIAEMNRQRKLMQDEASIDQGRKPAPSPTLI
jgi:hypothetical protein